MSELLKKYFLPINLLLLTTGIFISAHLLTFYIGKKLEIPYNAHRREKVTRIDVKKEKSLKEYNIILERNIFNSRSLADLDKSPEPVVSTIKEEEQPLSIRLVGTVAGNPLYAYAIIEDPYKKEHKIFRIDETIAPGIKLIEIHRNMIVISRNGKREEIEIETEKGKGFTKKRHVPPPPRPVLSPSSDVVQSSPNSYVVDRKTLEAATRDMSRLLTQARLVPNFTGGVADGFRIFSIVPNSLFDKIGLRNGDILHSINGIELKEPEKAFQIYQMLKDEDRFVIDLVRAGQRMTLNYEVR